MHLMSTVATITDMMQNHIAWSTTRDGNSWQWHIKSHVFHDPHHPVEGKASLMFLKRHGELRLRFQQNDNRWQEVSTQLGPMFSTKEPFTHAAFASDNDNKLLLAAYDVARRLHLFRVETIWNVPPEKKNANSGPFDKPTIQVTHIMTEDNCGPTNITSDDLSNGVESRSAVAAQLTHLNILPMTPEQDDGSLPTIQAIFCRPPDVVSFDQLQPQEPSYSVIVRWEIHQVQQNQLHPSLDQVTSQKTTVGSVTAKNVLVLKRQPDYDLHTVALAYHSMWYNMLLGFCYSDGTIEIKKRSTMGTIMPDGSTDTMTSLVQAGFAFPHAEPAQHVAFSPNHCVAACMQLDGSISLRSMEYQNGVLSTDDDEPRHSAALAALVLQSASAANQYYSNDDIFSIMGSLSEKRKRYFINLLFDGLQVNVDCGIDDTSTHHLVLLGRSPFFVKTLSAMNLLGLQGTNTRSLTSKMAWIILNIKYVTQILTTIARMHGAIEKTSLRPEVVPQFIGICRWIMHFMAYIFDELFTLGRALDDVPASSLTKDVLEKEFQNLNKPVVLLLLSSFPRAMMKLWQQPINWVKRSAETFTNATQPTPSPEIRRLYTPLHTAVNEVPFQWRCFDQIVTDTQNHVRAAYKHANLSDVQRNLTERELMLGRIPEILVPIARRLVTDTLFNEKTPGGCLSDKLDVGRLMFFDTTWLGFTESKRSTEWHDTHVVDVCQKMIIRGIGTQSHPSTSMTQQNRTRSSGSIQSTNGVGAAGKVKMRCCVRCGEYMEDVVQGLPGYTTHHASWLMGVAKHCVCGNSWMLAEEKKRAH
jgi:mediator of RNA polymerase II transcription subunit 16